MRGAVLGRKGSEGLCHPEGIFLGAASRISEENLQDIPDAIDLWVMRISHSLRVLNLKYGVDHLKKLLREMGFPDECITSELALIGECCSVIVGIEAEDARKPHSGIAVSMRGVWSKTRVKDRVCRVNEYTQARPLRLSPQTVSLS